MPLGVTQEVETSRSHENTAQETHSEHEPGPIENLVQSDAEDVFERRRRSVNAHVENEQEVDHDNRGQVTVDAELEAIAAIDARGLPAKVREHAHLDWLVADAKPQLHCTHA